MIERTIPQRLALMDEIWESVVAETEPVGGTDARSPGGIGREQVEANEMSERVPSDGVNLVLDRSCARDHDSGYRHDACSDTESHAITASDVRRLTVVQRIELIGDIWDSLISEGWRPTLTEELKAELDRRIAEDRAHPEQRIPWEEVKLAARRACR